MRFFIVLTLLLYSSLIIAQRPELPDILKKPPSEETLDWWRDSKFGIMICYGVATLPGEGGGFALWFDQTPIEEYEKLAEEFNPEPDAMEQWASVASEAGSHYLVLTTRFCDGFAIWPSQTSWRDFTIRKSPVEFDPVEKYVEACRKYDLGVGYYYSPGDWRMPGFWFPGMYRGNAEEMKEQGYGQVRELLTEYGKIDIMWWDVGGDDCLGMGYDVDAFEYKIRDYNWPQENHYAGPPLWEGNRFNAMVRELQPDILINDRGSMVGYEFDGDFYTPEGVIGEFDIKRDWETCEIFSSGGWFWGRDPVPNSLENIINTMVRVVTGGGNYLLGVGPRPDGYIESQDVERLKEIGQWLKKYGESIYGTRGGPHMNGEWGGFTQKDNILYLHVLDWSKLPESLPRISQKIKKVTCLTGGKVKYSQNQKGLAVSVSGGPEDTIDTIIKFELSSK